MRFETDGDLYVPNCLGLQIDSKGAVLQVQKSVDKASAEIGEPINYTVVVTNNGSIRAETVALYVCFPTRRR